ncbi:MAG: GNAT family N-acetyltransferase [Chloroflexota bacterium]|nr:GNAT family N-acetyltransferase [Chloroflexota bacterium]
MSPDTPYEERGRTAALSTERGTIRLKTHCPPQLIEGMELDAGIGVFPHYRSIVWDRERLARIAALEGANVVLAYTDEGKIVGYIAFSYPGPNERWHRDGAGTIYELGSIEVSRDWRRMGIATRMVELAMADDSLEDRIVLLTGYSWHWDLQMAGLKKPGYRTMLMNLFRPYGFRQYYTTEANINLDPYNVLLARIGSRVSEDERERFLDLLFTSDGAEHPPDDRF